MSCKDRSVVFLPRGVRDEHYRWGASLRIQPPLIHSRYYVRNAKRQVVAGVNERRPYLQASREPDWEGKISPFSFFPVITQGYLSLPFLYFPFTLLPLLTHTHTPASFGHFLFFGWAAKGALNSLLKFPGKISVQNIFSSFLPNIIDWAENPT